MSEYNHGLNLASNDVLLIVDLQNDFLPGGALGIEGADEIIPTINAYIEKFEQKQQCIIFSRDWHPQDHCSFNNQSGPWPVHCVQNTHGAALSNILNWPSQALLVSKANTSSEDAYSAFEKTALATRLKNMHIERLFITFFLNALEYPIEYIIDIFSTLPDFNKEITKYQVDFAKKKAYTPHSCETLKTLNLWR